MIRHIHKSTHRGASIHTSFRCYYRLDWCAITWYIHVLYFRLSCSTMHYNYIYCHMFTEKVTMFIISFLGASSRNTTLLVEYLMSRLSLSYLTALRQKHEHVVSSSEEPWSRHTIGAGELHESRVKTFPFLFIYFLFVLFLATFISQMFRFRTSTLSQFPKPINVCCSTHHLIFSNLDRNLHL